MDPWKIPDSWSWVEASQIADIVGGGTPRTDDASNFDAGEIPWITPADLSGYRDKFIARGGRNITKKGLDNSGARLLPAGTVLFSSRAPIGYVAIASNPVSTNQGFKSFVLQPSVRPDYMYYYLQRAKELAVELSSGTTFREISGAKAALIPVPIAPYPEQARIVEEIEKQFTRLDAAVAALKRVQANLKRYRAAVLRAACEGRLVPTEAELARCEGRSYEPASELLKRILTMPQARWESKQLHRLKASGKSDSDDSWKNKYIPAPPLSVAPLPRLPEGWLWATTGQVGDVQLGRQRSPKHHSGTHMRPYLRVANVFEDRIDTSDILSMNFTPSEFTTFELKSGDVLLNEGQSLELVGRAALYRGEVPGACFQNTLIRFRPYAGVDAAFALLVFRSYLHNQRFQKIARWTTNMAHLGAGRLSAVEFPVPPLNEQLRIVAEADRRLSILNAIDKVLKASFKRADSLRQSILKEAFEGKLAVQNPSDEPANALLDRIRVDRKATHDSSPTVPRGRQKKTNA
jgi:type I restriction enzyme S subunit